MRVASTRAVPGRWDGPASPASPTDMLPFGHDERDHVQSINKADGLHVQPIDGIAPRDTQHIRDKLLEEDHFRSFVRWDENMSLIPPPTPASRDGRRRPRARAVRPPPRRQSCLRKMTLAPPDGTQAKSLPRPSSGGKTKPGADTAHLKPPATESADTKEPVLEFASFDIEMLDEHGKGWTMEKDGLEIMGADRLDAVIDIAASPHRTSAPVPVMDANIDADIWLTGLDNNEQLFEMNKLPSNKTEILTPPQPATSSGPAGEESPAATLPPPPPPSMDDNHDLDIEKWQEIREMLFREGFSPGTSSPSSDEVSSPSFISPSSDETKQFVVLFLKILDQEVKPKHANEDTQNDYAAIRDRIAIVAQQAFSTFKNTVTNLHRPPLGGRTSSFSTVYTDYNTPSSAFSNASSTSQSSCPQTDSDVCQLDDPLKMSAPESPELFSLSLGFDFGPPSFDSEQSFGPASALGAKLDIGQDSAVSPLSQSTVPGPVPPPSAILATTTASPAIMGMGGFPAPPAEDMNSYFYYQYVLNETGPHTGDASFPPPDGIDATDLGNMAFEQQPTQQHNFDMDIASGI